MNHLKNTSKAVCHRKGPTKIPGNRVHQEALPNRARSALRIRHFQFFFLQSEVQTNIEMCVEFTFPCWRYQLITATNPFKKSDMFMMILDECIIPMLDTNCLDIIIRSQHPTCFSPVSHRCKCHCFKQHVKRAHCGCAAKSFVRSSVYLENR